MIPLLAAVAMPLIQELMSKGLTALAGAVANKGKEFVEEKLNIKLEEQITPEKALEYKQIELDNEADLRAWALENRKLDIEAEKIAQGAVTDRWNADLHSDNKLSKNIRPATLIYLLLVTTLLALLDSIPAIGVVIKPVWVNLFADALQLVLGAYFLARSVEKGVTVWQDYKTKREAKDGTLG